MNKKFNCSNLPRNAEIYTVSFV